MTARNMRARYEPAADQRGRLGIDRHSEHALELDDAGDPKARESGPGSDQCSRHGPRGDRALAVASEYS
jgi:hypothetical protein